METLLALLVTREGNPPVTSGLHPKGPVLFSMIREKAVDQAIESYMIWDTAKSMSRYYIGAWAGLMWSFFLNLIVIQILPDISV